jgi:CRISPR/Cas system-associated endonuclease Cas1
MVTFDALYWLARQDIALIALTYAGDVTTIMPAPSVVRQHAAAADPLPIARWLILRKIEAARATLTEICPTAVAATSVIERSLIELRDEPPQTLATLRGIEGRCGAAYFGALRTRPLRWAGIKRRPIPDDWHAVGLRPALPGGGNRKARLPVQAMLNLGYAVLEARVKIAATAAGFALDHAFLHGPQGSRMAPRSPLALDLQEPLRGVVDRAVLRFATSRTFRPGDFVIMTDGVCRLHPQLARVVVGVVDHELGSIASPASAPRRVVRELVALIGTR